ncbi:MAG: hypothetical protein HGA44_06070 [Cellulomonadaceae bacterium]|nr:hypothetical protein [Cellulomonadaceae bacterium]
MNVGDAWIFRARDMAPSERVRVVADQREGRPPRVEVEFLDDQKAGTVKKVSPSRLCGPWSGVATFDALMANWARVSVHELDETEETAVYTVFERLVPRTIATVGMGYSRNCLGIHDMAALEATTGRPVAHFVDAVPSFRDNGTWWLPSEGAVLVAEAACRAAPVPILDCVTEEERQEREACKRGKRRKDLDGNSCASSSEWEYRLYLELGRPVYELLRQWCGHRAVSFYDRLGAAEAEIQRLDELIARAADAMRSNNLDSHARWLDDEHERDRVTPFTIRPTVDRPLSPDELPLQTVYRRRWWR